MVMHGTSSPDDFDLIYSQGYFLLHVGCTYTSVRGVAVIYCMLAVTVTSNCILSCVTLLDIRVYRFHVSIHE